MASGISIHPPGLKTRPRDSNERGVVVLDHLLYFKENAEADRFFLLKTPRRSMILLGYFNDALFKLLFFSTTLTGPERTC